MRKWWRRFWYGPDVDKPKSRRIRWSELTEEQKSEAARRSAASISKASHMQPPHTIPDNK
jgi:hypothetical protein